MKFLTIFILACLFTYVFRLIFSKFNIIESRRNMITWILGVICSVVSVSFYEAGDLIELSTATNDVTISNFKFETAYKEFGPKYASDDYSETELRRFVIIYSMDITNNSGAPIINFDGNGLDGKPTNGGRFYTNFILNNFNDMGDYKELAATDLYIFDNGKEVEEFNDENPFPDKKTYKIYGYIDLMGQSLGSTDSKFIDYFSAETKFDPELTIKLLGSTPSDRTKYWFKEIEPKIDVSKIREDVKKYEQDTSLLQLIWRKTKPYGFTKLTNNPWKNNMKFKEENRLSEPHAVICQLFNLTPKKGVLDN